MTKKSTTTHTPMTKKSAARIQGAADRSSTNQGFKARAQRAAAKSNPKKAKK